MNKQKQNNKVLGVIVWVIAIFICISIAIPSGDNSSPISTPKSTLELVEAHACPSGYINAVCGTVKNNSSRSYGYAQVEINLYSKDGSLIGSTLDNINNLGAGESWKFKAMIIEDNVARYEIKDVTGF